MKKLLSLFLALVMALSLCTTAFAGNTTGTSVLRLTGDATDQVVNLKNGQRLSTDSSTLLRLNVLSDPSAEEYTVTLDGETLAVDHSTSQYHFYALPASQTSGVTTLSVSSVNSDDLSVTVNGTEREFTLPTDGSTDAKSPTAVTVEFSYAETSGAMDRIYFNVGAGANVSLGTSLSSAGVLSGTLAELDAGLTSQQLYFYTHPKAQTKSVKAVWTDGDGTPHYYTITVKRAAQEGYVLAPGSSSNESNPGGVNTYDADTGCITAMIKGYAEATFTYHDLTLYNSGATTSTSTSPAFPTDETALYYLKDGTTACFARPGRYWVPASVEADGVTYTGEAPFLATLTLTALNAYLEQAQAVQADSAFTALPESVQTRFNAIVTRLTAGKSDLSSKVMLTAAGVIAGDGDTASAIQACDFDGKALVTERLLEGDECALLDLMAIFNTFKTDQTLGQYQAEAYAKIQTLNVNSYTDVTTLEQKALYSQVKQAKWDLLKTTDLDGVNAILTSLTLETIDAPAVTLGDINDDGEISLKDATLLVQYVNELTTLTDTQLAAADINDDGEVTLKDATLLVQYVNELISTLEN